MTGTTALVGAGTQARRVCPQTQHSVVVHLVPHTMQGLHGLVNFVHDVGGVFLGLDTQVPSDKSALFYKSSHTVYIYVLKIEVLRVSVMLSV